VHTLGLDPSGYFYLRVIKQMGRTRRGAWVLQLRGGSDLALARFDPEKSPGIAEAFRECDQVLTDNRQNFTYVCELGGRPDQLAPINPVPGTGGVNVEALRRSWRGSTSSRRMILWPKSYECPWSKALPVLEAIRTAWPAIQPCEIAALTMPPEVEMWLRSLPQEIQRAFQVFQGIPRPRVLELLAGSRVMLAPSLVDGVPNSLYEAMALGAFPVVSPLETIADVVRDEANVLFARNLYPDEIASALFRAMNDDALVERAAENNLALVATIANRALIAPQVIRFYAALAEGSNQPHEGQAP
jgi:glycosyltransferase involved in cell wall biosynthesis